MARSLEPLGSGLVTGLFLQLAVGPVFLYILGLTLAGSFAAGLAGILGVTLADFLYISLSLAGVGRLLETPGRQRLLGLAGSAVLILFGLLTLRACLAGGAGEPGAAGGEVLSSGQGFFRALVLTLSSPLTIVFWSGVFSARAAEKDYRRSQLVWFGLGAGSATFLFLTAAMGIAALAGRSLPGTAVRILNGLVGAALIVYGILRGFRLLARRETE